MNFASCAFRFQVQSNKVVALHINLPSLKLQQSIYIYIYITIANGKSHGNFTAIAVSRHLCDVFRIISNIAAQ